MHGGQQGAGDEQQGAPGLVDDRADSGETAEQYVAPGADVAGAAAVAAAVARSFPHITQPAGRRAALRGAPADDDAAATVSAESRTTARADICGLAVGRAPSAARRG